MSPTPASTTPLRIAIQKSGRLTERCLRLLEAIGLDFSVADGRLLAPVKNFAIELLFLRDDDIPAYVADGIAALGFVGENVLIESGVDVSLVARLGLARCALVLAVPKAAGIVAPAELNGKTIATSFPDTTRRYLDERGIDATVVTLEGSVEVAPALGVAEAIADLTQTGSTLRQHDLVPLDTLLESELVLAGNRAALAATGAHSQLIDRLVRRLDGVLRARHMKYVMMNAPADAVEAIAALLGGLKSPTVMPLADPGLVAVHAVVHEDEFWDKAERFRALGATGICLLPIEKLA